MRLWYLSHYQATKVHAQAHQSIHKVRIWIRPLTKKLLYRLFKVLCWLWNIYEGAEMAFFPKWGVSSVPI